MATELVIGQPYFLLGYADRDFTLPLIKSLVYIGRDLDPSGPPGTRWYFQDPESYAAKGAFPRDAWGIGAVPEADLDKIEGDEVDRDVARLYTFGVDTLSGILSLEALAHALTRLALA
jgi:hypothetical protein